MAKTKKTAPVADATPRKSSRISEAKRKATEEVSPASTKKIKAVVADKVAAVAPEEPVKQKKTKKAAAAAAAAPAPAPAPSATPAKSKKSKKAAAVVAEEDKENDKAEEEKEEEQAEEDKEVAVEDDDTTKALVQEIDAEDEDNEPSGGASLFQPGQDVGKAPAAGVKKAVQIKNAKKASSSASSSAAAAAVAAPAGEATEGQQQYGGIVYVGRIPHGFFEHEMRSYFSQFGDIRRLRLSRNRKTGASKHYAFVEFADGDVAEIVAKTMDNYLLFGHILRCSVVAAERIPPNLFKGANRRFKAVPWNLMSGRRMAQPKPESAWSNKISREAKRRAGRAAQLEKTLGYSFDGPELKSVDAIEAPASAIEDKKVEAKKVEAKKVEAKKVEAVAPAPAEAEPEVVPVAAKGKKAKGKKAKA